MGFAVAIPAILAAVGAVGQGISSSHAASAQGEIARNNAIQAGRNAQFTSEQGTGQEILAGERSRGQQGAIRTGFGANGVDPNTGSPADVARSARDLAQQDALTIRSNSARQAYGYKTQQQGGNTQALLDASAAQSAAAAGGINAAGSLLSGLSDAQRQYAPISDSTWSGASSAIAGNEGISLEEPPLALFR